jgi:hypothetical protein
MPPTEDTFFPPAADNLDQPANWLSGVIDDPRMAEQAVQALYSAGFAKDDVLLLHGPDALKRMEAKDEQRGLLGWAHKAISSVLTDASSVENTYVQEAAAGHSIINIHAENEDEIERARAVLADHQAHYIKHFGQWTITHLS